MTFNRGAIRLRCALCKKGLLRNYNVYDVPVDKYGAEQKPILYSQLTGYFYKKDTRHKSEKLDIPGSIAEKAHHTCKLMVFELTFKKKDLVDIGGEPYKIIEINEIYNPCYILTLEAYPYGI